MLATGRTICIATTLAVIRRLCKIIFTASIFLSVVDDNRSLSLISYRISLNRLYHNWTCVLLIVDSPNAIVNIADVLEHLIYFFTQNLVQLFFLFFFFILILWLTSPHFNKFLVLSNFNFIRHSIYLAFFLTNCDVNRGIAVNSYNLFTFRN